MADATDCLIVFTRAPELGRCKRRLAATLGDAAALAAHIQLVEHTLTQLKGFAGRKRLSVTHINTEVVEWSQRYVFEPTLQVDGELGERMYGALDAALHSGAKRVVLVGSDCPDIDLNYVEAAFTQLLDRDLVLGPAEDGGYGLVGLNVVHQAIFEDIVWGGAQVLSQTCAKAQGLNWRVGLLDEVWDVDDVADWQRYQAMGINPA